MKLILGMRQDKIILNCHLVKQFDAIFLNLDLQTTISLKIFLNSFLTPKFYMWHMINPLGESFLEVKMLRLDHLILYKTWNWHHKQSRTAWTRAVWARAVGSHRKLLANSQASWIIHRNQGALSSGPHTYSLAPSLTPARPVRAPMFVQRSH
jgi:hypothetical protein